MRPERFSNLPDYPFARLRALYAGHSAGDTPLSMSIGEPTHAFPSWVSDLISEHAAGFNVYPPNDGTPELRENIAAWLKRRYDVSLDPEQNIIALNGTREGLYNAAMGLCPETKSGKQPLILTPNPFYQVYMFAALSVGAKSVFVPATHETGFLPDYTGLSEDILNQTALAYICSPSNPQGSVATRDYWRSLIQLAERYDFKILADECYSEIYRDEAPTGALEVVKEMGADPERVLVFHSLSKRSNLPGLRSGFAAGGSEAIQQLKTIRAYAGAPLPLPLQRAAEAVWADEDHVAQNRALYAEKFDLADNIFAQAPGYQSPEAGFFLWLPCDNGEDAALKLWVEEGVRVLPGAYLSQDVDNYNPGQTYIRVALVADKDQTEKGLLKIRRCLYEE